MPRTTSAPIRWVLVVLAVFAAACASDAADESSSPGLELGDLGELTVEFPPFDPDAPPPSPGAIALGELAVLEPGVSVLTEDVEAAERAAIAAALADLPATAAADDGDGPSAMAPVGPEATVHGLASSAAQVAVLGNSPQQDAAGGTSAAGFMTLLVSGLGDQLTQYLEPGTPPTGVQQTVTEGGTTATLSAEIGRAADGSTKFGLGVATEASKGGVAASTDAGGTVEGKRCPDANGKVEFTATVHLASASGETSLDQKLTATVTATVGDDARIIDSVVDVVQGTRRVQGGRQVYVETGMRGVFDAQGEVDVDASDATVRVIRQSQQATSDDVQELSDAGLRGAVTVGRGSLYLAQNAWQAGACTKIEATAPGLVEPGSTTEIPVTVRHRVDGSSVVSTLVATVASSGSVDPTSLPKTPGTVSYKAPDQRNKSATITLTATSRRGIAKLELAATTGRQSYVASGGGSRISVSGTVADLTKPFTLEGTFPGGGATLSFSPTDEHGGTYTFSGDFGMTGNGTYTVSEPDENGVRMLSYKGHGCVGTGGGCADTAADVTLTPQ